MCTYLLHDVEGQKVRKHLSAYHMQYSNLFESAVYGMQKMPEGLLTLTSLYRNEGKNQ